jgi:hypothetical protein
MRLTLAGLLVLALTLTCLPASADTSKLDPRNVVIQPFRVTGTAINSGAGKVAIGKGGTTITSDWLPVGRTSEHAIASTLTATATVSVVYTVTCGVAQENSAIVAVTPNPAITITRTATATPRLDPISLPVCTHIRVAIAADATYPTTTTQLELAGW